MQILTFDELRGYRNKFEMDSVLSVEDLLTECENYSYDKNIFLSHSSKDKDDILPNVIQFLESLGGSVYIDKEDGNLPKHTNRNTAEVLKDNIEKIPKFILIVTKNSFESKWIPWELGLADGIGKYDNIALLPIGEYENDTQWLGQEYLGLYQKIVKDSYGDWIIQSNDKYSTTEFKEWINE